MAEPLTVKAEVWPIAADRIGLWLLSGDDAWRSGVIMSDSSVHWEILLLLASHDIGLDTPLIVPRRSTRGRVVTLHGVNNTDAGAGEQWTSWRPDPGSVIHTYIAAIEPRGEFARDEWPDAKPVTQELFAKVKKPPTHGATEEPMPRWIDVMFHALRHLRWLRDNNGENAAKLGPYWHQHLEPFEQELAKMYSERHAAA
jgi:hypothetical protein